jgi:hypothetical protein
MIKRRSNQEYFYSDAVTRAVRRARISTSFVDADPTSTPSSSQREAERREMGFKVEARRFED